MIFEWKAPSRPFKKRNRQFFTVIAIIAVLISMILFFAGQYLPIAVVISVVFLAYVLYTFPPEIITNQLTTYGVKTEGKLYYWEELGRFWFESRLDQEIVNIEVGRFPWRLSLLTGEASKSDLEMLFSEVLLHERPPDTFVDKTANWLQEKIPIE